MFLESVSQLLGAVRVSLVKNDQNSTGLFRIVVLCVHVRAFLIYSFNYNVLVLVC